MTDNKNRNVFLKLAEDVEKTHLHNYKKRCEHLRHTFDEETNYIHYAATDEVKVLQRKLVEFESRCNSLTQQIDKNNLDLDHERRKVKHLERQLQFAKDNQFIFKNIGNSGVNASGDRKIIEVRDKSVQTWKGVLCRACLDTERVRSELERTKEEYNGCVLIKRNAMDRINETVGQLRDVTTFK